MSGFPKQEDIICKKQMIEKKDISRQPKPLNMISTHPLVDKSRNNFHTQDEYIGS